MEHRIMPPPEPEVTAAETEEHPPPEPSEEPDLRALAAEPVAEEDAPTELYEGGLEYEAASAGHLPPEATVEEPVEDEFFSEQSLSDELDRALDAPEAEAPVVPEVDGPAPEEPLEPEPLEPEEPDWDQPGEDEPEAPEEREDVLEETPEFLQDTPEHDRLWFEQKPPKDFDFDD
jgi:hypothetical protein